MHHPSSRAARRATTRAEALAEFHELAGHPGEVDDCADCEQVQREQRQAAAALRAHQRRTRQRIDRIIGRSS
jgi:aminoglycoside phosphotransferase family enzyme